MTDPQEAPVTDLATNPTITPWSEIRVELKIDAELLLEAQRQIGAASPDQTVNEALQRWYAEGWHRRVMDRR